MLRPIASSTTPKHCSKSGLKLSIARRPKEPFDQATLTHLLGRQVVELWRVDQGNRITQLLGNIQFVGRKEDAFLLLMRQATQ